MTNYYKVTAYGIIGAGVILFLYFAFGFKIQTVDAAEYISTEELHPLRWIYALVSLIVTLFFGSVLIGLSQLIEGNGKERERINQIDERVKVLSDKVKYNR